MDRRVFRKSLFSLIVFILISLLNPVIYANEQQIQIFMDGARLDMGDTAPFIENGRTLVPMRLIFEALGVKVEWNGNTRTVTGSTDDSGLRLTIGSSDVIVNGLKKQLDVPAKIEGDRTYVPLRFVAESMGADVQWNASSRTVSIERRLESDIKLVKGINKIVFADEELGKSILTLNDDYMRSLSEFDISSKMRTDSKAGIDEFKQHFSEQVRSFTKDEMDVINGIIEEVRPLIGNYVMYFPEETVFIKTTGREEANAAYTRSNAIILPQSMVNMNRKFLRDIIIHEFFHIFSRYNSGEREQLYDVIGFKKGAYFEYPEELADLRLSNPDAVDNRYYIELDLDGERVKAVPVLYASEKFNTSKSPSFFDYLVMKLAVVEVSEGSCTPVYRNGELLMIESGEAFYKRVGFNSDYIIQPEELLADNFVMMINNTNVPSPFVIQGIKNILQVDSVKGYCKGAVFCRCNPKSFFVPS